MGKVESFGSEGFAAVSFEDALYGEVAISVSQYMSKLG